MTALLSLRSGPALVGAMAFGAAALGASAVSHAERRESPPFPVGADLSPPELTDIDVIEHLGDKVPGGLTFHDASGAKVELDALLGQKPVLVTLGYYRCPMLCGMVLEGLAKAIRGSGLKLGEDFHAVSISIDPEEDAKLARDTQARIVRAAAGDTDSGAWPFLLGDRFGSRVLADAVGFKYKYDEQSRQFAHAAVAFVLTPEGRVSRYLYGVDVLPRDFRFAMVEAGGGRVGTTLDRVLLTCFRYDPINRRYAPFVMGFMRIGAGLCFLALAGLLALLWRRELVMRRARRAAA